MKHPSSILAVFSALWITGTSLHAEVRTFTSAAGTTIQGELVSVNGDLVTIKKEDGHMLTVKATAFSRVDQAWLQANKAKSATVVVQPVSAKKESPFINSLNMGFVPVKGLAVLFCIHETRRQDYAAYASETPNADGSWKKQTYQGQPCGQEEAHPVVGVSWNDARQFCDWLSAKEGRKYRLPTDQEWSMAVGLGKLERREKDSTPESLNAQEKTFYPWEGSYPPTNEYRSGNYPDTTLRAVMKNFGLEAYTDGYAGTAPVMSFKVNKFGLYDMGGNVWEWVEDTWNTGSQEHVKRGGSFAWLGRSALLASTRGHEAPGTRSSVMGFRIVLELTGTSAAP